MKTKMVTQESRRNTVLCLLFLLLIASPGTIAFANPDNPNPAPVYTTYGSVAPGFDPDSYSFLVYDCGTDINIQEALPALGIKHFSLRTASNPVTANDLTTHDVLIVSWNYNGNTSGLNPAVLEAGITGRVLLTGHDLDFHTVQGTPHDQGDFQPADIVLSQAIEFVLAGGGTGLVGLTDPTTVFAWLPSKWGITAVSTGTEVIQSFTDAGLDSGVFDGVLPEHMSGWSQSYHNTFTAWGDAFTPFELGADDHVVTIAAPLSPLGFNFRKYDDIADGNCVNIGDPIQYTLIWKNTTAQTFHDAYLLDILPAGVTPVNGSDPFYQDDHTYVYPIGTLDPNDSGVLQLDVIVNASAASGSVLHNTGEIWATFMVSTDPNDPNVLTPVERLVARAELDTPVCCYFLTPEILYVDRKATPGGNGFSWDTAFSNLQDALNYARNALCGDVQSIHVAQGTYSPGDSENDSFDLTELPGILLVGGFPSGGSDYSMRNPKRYETVLSGKIDATRRNEAVLRVGGNTYVDGFTIMDASQEGYGIYSLDVDFTVTNSRITRNEGYGAFIENGNADFQWCHFVNNKRDGIRHTGEGKTLLLENVWVRQSGRHAVFSTDSVPTIINSVLSESDLAFEGRAGLRMENATHRPYLQNCTISHNRTFGIRKLGGNTPLINNSIVYHNGGPALVGFSAEEAAWYSCIEDANSISERHVINTDPKFAYFDPNNVRLSPESIGLLGGSNPALMATYMHQRDMDGQPRVTVLGTPPDMGAYQLACDTNVSSPWDTNADGVVNILDGWDEFARAWGSVDPNNPEWISNPGIADPNLSEGWYEWKYRYNYVSWGQSAYTIDLEDFLYWVDEAPYLWCACWYQADSCGDEHSIYDFDRDGLVNLYEFSLLSSVWGTYQPENPIWQFCNFVQDETIDIADMVVFLDNWLWVSCTRQSEFPQPAPMPAPLPPAEPTILEQAIELQSAICMLETVQNEPNFLEQIDPSDWQDFMDAVYQQVDDLTGQLSEMELLVLELLAPECGTEQMAMSGSGDLFAMYSVESEPVETDLTYTEMPTGELASLATGIYSILNEAETALAQGGENAQEWLEIRDFMLTILADIKASRQ